MFKNIVALMDSAVLFPSNVKWSKNCISSIPQLVATIPIKAIIMVIATTISTATPKNSNRNRNRNHNLNRNPNSNSDNSYQQIFTSSQNRN